MSITATAQELVNWARQYIPDRKTQLFSVRNEEIGRTALPTSQRESFYLKRPAVGSVFLYVDPYKYSAASTLLTAAATDKVFLYNATLQKCTFPGGSDPSIRPAQFKAVLADYEYTKSIPYVYSDDELVGFAPAAIAYLNNNHSTSYSYTGTGSTFEQTFTSDSDNDLVARSLAILVRRTFVSEQMRHGLGVAFRGPMAAIDSKSQLKAYQDETKKLEQSIVDKIENDKISSASGSGGSVDLYDESVVTG